MKRSFLAVAALSAIAMAASNATAQQSETETELRNIAIDLKDLSVKPRSDFPAQLIPTDRFASRLNSGTFTSLNLFSNDLHSAEYILGKSDEIELTEAQRQRIIDIEAESQARLTRLRLENEGSDSRLDALLSEHPIDADAALSELDRLMQSERGPKREQLATLIAIRNVLTETQVEKLADLRGPFRIQFLDRAAFISDASSDTND